MKTLLMALLLPCMSSSQPDAAQRAETPCPKQAAKSDIRTPRWETGRGFIYARY